MVRVAAVVAVLLPLTGSNAAGQLIALAGVILAFTQGVRRHGWGRLIAFFVISYVVSSIWENLSVMTGFPFGNWMTANTILERADEHLDLRTRTGRLNVVALPVLAGAVMTMFDVGIDSISSTVRHSWVWEQGGGVFGVPFTNYLGWWFVTWSFFQIFALVLARRQTRRTGSVADLPRVSHLQPVLVYMLFGITSVSAFLGFTEGPVVVDATGTSWDTSAIFESPMIFNLFSILPVSLFAIVKIVRGDLDRA